MVEASKDLWAPNAELCPPEFEVLEVRVVQVDRSEPRRVRFSF